ncbi:inactive tyrosine-protein kinase PRAG1 [Brachyhypopomus gauderio]|uniref:inactive tyrosine-protein kinase PRAG1 n=1 Tax=Brachyhypopomus gauderio TaxID=698409 RepID=UPI0040415A38
MSVCGEFAEHVWKPGSCKNCFHPRSAHTQADRVGGANSRPSVGGANARISGGGDEDCGGVSPSPYSKPIIAVRPTMMNTDATETTVDDNMNSDQVPKCPAGLKILDLSPLYMDGNGCNKALREALLQAGIPGKRDNGNRLLPCMLSPPGLPEPSHVTGGVFVTMEENLKDNGNGDPYRPHLGRAVKSGYVDTQDSHLQGHAQRSLFQGSCEGVTTLGSAVQEVQTTLGIGLVAGVPGNGASSVSKETSSASSSPAVTPDSRNISLSDSCSYGSSSDSLAGPDVFHHCGPESPRDPAGWGSPSTGRPDRRASGEPIYAESSKRKHRPHHHAELSTVDPKASGTAESPRATITVVAAHTEENNRIFYLSSPDSAVSTQWQRFNSATPDDPASPAFSWPSTPSTTETTPATSVAPSLQTKPQSSPPIPPKRSARSPKLGTSSLSPLPFSELSCPAALSPKAGSSRLIQGDAESSGSDAAPVERRQKLHNTWSLEGRIEEEEEEGEGETRAAQEGGPHGGSGGSLNGPAVWGSEASERSGADPSHSTPGTDANNSASQRQAGTRAQDAVRSGSVLGGVASNPFSTSSTQLSTAAGQGTSEPRPPPPPPKKHHRVCNKLSSSAMELDVLSQGSVESLTHSVKGNGCNTASSDSMTALSDSGAQESSVRSCPSPFPSSPLATSPGSPHPDPFPSNSLGRQIQPPPLPEKKLVNRTVSAPGEAGPRGVARTRPRLPFSGSESNVCRAEGAGLHCPQPTSQPCSPVAPRPFSASSDSLDGGRRPLCSRTLDEPQVKGHGRLGGHSRGSLTSCSSPQLSTLAPSSAAGGVGVALGGAAGMGSALQLHALLSNMDSRECIYSKLGGLYAESLRRLALKCEGHFTRRQREQQHFGESNWSLFKLTCNTACCLAGDAVYYSASCASDVGNTYAVKICKGQSADSRQAHLYGLSVQHTIPLHFNLQQDCGHFIACVPQSMLPGEETPAPPAGPPAPPPGPSAPPAGPSPSPVPEQERVVVITREVPCQTAADFVREWGSFHRAQPEVYERRVCFLLLQLCNGLEHLKTHGVTHRDLCLENLLLVPHRLPGSGHAPGSAHTDPQQQHLPRLLISNFSKAKQRSTDDSASSGDQARLRRDHARLAPEIVSAAQYRKFDEFQTGILIYELLHQPNPFEVSPELREQDYQPGELPAIPTLSIYSAGLLRLARLLLQPDPIKRVHIQEAKRGLQSLLWGPRRELMEQQVRGVAGGGARGVAGAQPKQDGLLNWLDVKRALLMMKFAERSLEPERNAELEDWLCCQYLSTAHPLALQHTAELLYGIRASR